MKITFCRKHKLTAWLVLVRCCRRRPVLIVLSRLPLALYRHNNAVIGVNRLKQSLPLQALVSPPILAYDLQPAKEQNIDEQKFFLGSLSEGA